MIEQHVFDLIFLLLGAIGGGGPCFLWGMAVMEARACRADVDALVADDERIRRVK